MEQQNESNVRVSWGIFWGRKKESDPFLGPTHWLWTFFIFFLNKKIFQCDLSPGWSSLSREALQCANHMKAIECILLPNEVQVDQPWVSVLSLGHSQEKKKTPGNSIMLQMLWEVREPLAHCRRSCHVPELPVTMEWNCIDHYSAELQDRWAARIRSPCPDL